MTLDEARANAKAQGLKSFTYNGKTYLTSQTAMMSPSDIANQTIIENAMQAQTGEVNNPAAPARSLAPPGPPLGAWPPSGLPLGLADAPTSQVVPIDVPINPPPATGVGGPTMPPAVAAGVGGAPQSGLNWGAPEPNLPDQFPLEQGTLPQQLPLAPGVEVPPYQAPTPPGMPPQVPQAAQPGAAPVQGGGQNEAGIAMAGQKALEPLRANPPQTPEEQTKRVGAWKSFLQQFQTDSSWQAIALRLGVNLMQPVAPGQTPLGHAGNSILDAADFGAKIVDTDIARRKQEEETQRIGAETRKTDAETSQTIPATADLARARSAQTYAETLTEDFLRGLKGDKLKAEIDKMKSEGILDEAKAKALKDQLENDPKYRAAVIRELNSRAKAHAENARAQNNTFTHIEKLKEAILADPNETAIQEMKKTNPAAADAMAYRKANAEHFQGMLQDQGLEQALQGEVDNLWEEYQALDEKEKKKNGFTAWIRNQLTTSGYKGKELAIISKLARQKVTGGGKPAAPAAPSAPAPGNRGGMHFDSNGKIVVTPAP